MNANTPASKSQKRILSLLGIALEKDSYLYAGKALEAVRYPQDGLPCDWRAAAKLNDADFLKAFDVQHERPISITEIAEGGY